MAKEYKKSNWNKKTNEDFLIKMDIPKSIEFDVIINYPNLRVRKGPGLSFEQIDMKHNGEKVHILEEKDGWGKIKEDQWILLELTRKV